MRSDLHFERAEPIIVLFLSSAHHTSETSALIAKIALKALSNDTILSAAMSATRSGASKRKDQQPDHAVTNKKKRRAKSKSESDDESDDMPPHRRLRQIPKKRSNDDDPLSWYTPKAHVKKYGGTLTEDRDGWMTLVSSTLTRDRVSSSDAPEAASTYLTGQAKTWYQETFRPKYNKDGSRSWEAFEKELKARFRQENKQDKALRLARTLAFTDLDDYLSQFADINKLYPQRAIIETTYDFAFGLPANNSTLRDQLLQQVPKSFQELFVRVQAWRGPVRRK